MTAISDALTAHLPTVPAVATWSDGGVGVAAPPTGVRCRACGAWGEVFLDHGLQTIANGFRDPDDSTEEPRFPIQYAFCPGCALVQLVAPPPTGALFHDAYPFLTGSSGTMRDHYAATAALLRARHHPKSVLEVGCNDGTLLQHFADLPHLGIEPSANVAALAQERGLRVWPRPFGLETACLVAATFGRSDADIQGRLPRTVDLLLACHALTHLVDLADFFAGVDVLLAPRGVVVLEDPALDAIVTAGDYAQLYDEHAWVLSAPAVARLAGRYGFDLLDAEPVPTHGGSTRYTLGRAGAHVPHPRVAERVQAERYLTHPYSLRNFAQDAGARLAKLRALLRDVHARGEVIAGYGASSKLSLTLNRLGLPPGTVAYVTDTTPTKVGKVMPGTHEPIVDRASVADGRLPDVFLLGAYVHLREVLQKERAYLDAGGRFVVWTPDVRVLGKDAPEAVEALA